MDPSAIAAMGWTALLETLPLGIALTLAVTGALTLLKGLTPSARHTIWMLTLLTVVALPFARGFLAPVEAVSFRSPAPAGSVPVQRPAAAPTPAFTAEAGASGALAPERRWAGWASRSGRLLMPSLPPPAPETAVGLTLLWLGIAFAFLLRACLSLSALLRMKAEGDLLPMSMQKWVFSLLQRRACRRRAFVRSHPALAVPITAGLGAPAVLIPRAMVRHLPEPHLKRVVLHETAHILRWDDWMHLAEHLFRALLFFHPAVWWIACRMQLEREMACDDLVVEATADPQGYARCLVTVAELAGRYRVRYPAPAIGRHPSQLARRITMIINHRKPFSRVVRALVLSASAAFLALALIPCVLAPREAQAAVPTGSPDLIASVIAVLPNTPQAAPVPPAPPAPVPSAPGAIQKAPIPPAPVAVPTPPKPVEPMKALDPLEPLEPIEPIEPIEAAVEEALRAAHLEGLDEEEIARQVGRAMKKAEIGMADAQTQMQRAEKQLLAERARLLAARNELDGKTGIISEAEMDALEARIESLGESIDQKVEARLEGIDWEKLSKAEARELTRERLRGLDEEIKGLTDQIKELSGQIAVQARLQALPEIEEALKEIRQAQEELKLEREKMKTR